MSKAIVRAETEAAIILAREVFGTEIPMPAIEFSNRMTRTLGQASARYKRIDDVKVLSAVKITYASKAIEMNPPETFVEKVVWHEVAHIVQLYMYGEGDHGVTFHQIMRKLGAKEIGRTTSGLATPPRRRNYSSGWVYGIGNTIPVKHLG